MQEKKSADSGMTLIEIIVAVSIFCIAAAILLQGFVTSGRINRKSNRYLEATSLAQNVMEEIKSRDFGDVSRSFNYPLDNQGRCRFRFLNDSVNETLVGGELQIKEVQKEGSSYKDVRQYKTEDGEDTSRVTASVISRDGGNTYEFNPRTAGENASQYFFQMTNVTNLREKFDVLVEFDGSRASGYKKKSIGKTEEGKNDFLTPNITRLDTKTNGFLIMGENWDQNAMNTMITMQLQEAQKVWQEDFYKWTEQYKNTHGQDPDTAAKEEYETANPKPAEQLAYEDVYAHTRRLLNIRLEQSGGTVTARASYVLHTYDYKKEGGGKYDTMSLCPCGGRGLTEDVDGCFCTYKSAYVSFYSSEADAELKNIFVFYYPNYQSTNTSEPLDEIVFDNTINLPVNLYVTKQRAPEEDKAPTLQQEVSYRVSMKIIEDPAALGNTNWNTNPNLYKSQTKLRTNLDYDISSQENISERTRLRQLTLTYTDNNRSVISSAKTIVDMNGLDDAEASDRIYTAKVSVYRAGAAAKGFPKEDLVVTLDGAKENG